MEPGITYCTAFPEDSTFGAILSASNRRWTSFCMANPEYDPEDMRQVVLHALDILLHGHENPFLGDYGSPDVGGHTLELCGNPQPQQPKNPHPDPGQPHAICHGPQTVGGRCHHPSPGQMAGRTSPHLQ